jgi:hypothetical protein
MLYSTFRNKAYSELLLYKINNFSTFELGVHTLRLDNMVIWISNFPYCYGHLYAVYDKHKESFYKYSYTKTYEHATRKAQFRLHLLVKDLKESADKEFYSNLKQAYDK